MNSPLMGAVVCVALLAVVVGVVDGTNENVNAIGDPCRQICKEYEDICLPTWTDPWNLFSPHCEDVRDVGWPGVSCILCLKNHGVPATLGSQVAGRPPNSDGEPGTTSGTFTEHPTPPTEADWPTNPSIDATTVRTCPEICTCTRTQSTTTEVTTSYCPLVYDEDYACDLNDPSAIVTSTDESQCDCVEDPSCATAAGGQRTTSPSQGESSVSS